MLYLILSSIILLQLIDNISLRFRISKIKKKLKEKSSETDALISLEPGDSVLYNAALTYNKEIKFNVSYECVVLQVSQKNVKLKGLKVSPLYTATFPSELMKDCPNNYEQVLLDYIENKWIERKDISPILEKSVWRDRKIDSLDL